MKYYIYCAIIAFLSISCSKNEDPSMDTPFDAPKTLHAQTPKFESRAVIECQPDSWDESAAVNSRTHIVVDNATEQTEYFQYWSPGNAISVFFTTANLKYDLQGYIENEDEGIFELSGDMVEGDELFPEYYYSVYPYKEDTKIFWFDGIVTYNFPVTQTYIGNSYADNENGMIAREPKEEMDNVLYFQNFCSYLQLQLYTDEVTPKKVTRLTLLSNTLSDKLTGPGEILYVDGNPHVNMLSSNSTLNKIVLDCGNGVELSQNPKNPTKFWFVLPGTYNFSKGFTVYTIFEDGTYSKKSTGKVIEIKRNHIKPMATFNTPSKDPNGPIRYKYHDTTIDTPYPLNNTFLGEDGLPLEIIDQVYDEENDEWVVLFSGTLKTIYDNSFRNPGPDIEYIKFNKEDNPIILNTYSFYNCTADSLIINNDVLEIGESAFTGSQITDLKINGNVTTIKESAGTGSKIQNLKINGNIEQIEQNAFNGCIDIQTFTVNNINSIGYRAFYNCINLTQSTIPGVQELGMGAFRACKKLKEIELNDIITIGDNAFMDCLDLTKVIIGPSCITIGEGAFCNDVRLQTVHCYATSAPFISTDNKDSSYVFDNTNNVNIQIPKNSFVSYFTENYFGDGKKNWWLEYKERLKPTLQ